MYIVDCVFSDVIVLQVLFKFSPSRFTECGHYIAYSVPAGREGPAVDIHQCGCGF